jgi:hypothetical protein
MTRGCLCVFAKPPRPGEAKTRLASVLGDAGAAALAHAFFLDTWAMTSRIGWADVVLATTDVGDPTWASIGAPNIWPQGPGTLGDRQERVLNRALARHPFAIVIGTDLPGLPRERLDAACAALQTADAVLGPTEDGGFYLLGLRRCPPGLLARLPWSAPDTFTRTLERLRSERLATAVIPSWWDVDGPSDLRRLRRLAASGRLDAPETVRVLTHQSVLAGPASAEA